MRSLVEDQQNHLVRAITRCGEYRLPPAFSEFEMDSSAWFELPESARINHVHKLKSAACKYVKKFASKKDDILPFTLEAAIPSSSSEESHCTEVDRPTSIDQALYARVTKCTAVPESTMNGIGQKNCYQLQMLSPQLQLMA